MKKALLFAVLLTAQFLLKAGGGDPPLGVGARASAMGYAYTAVRADFWGLFQNPAGIAGIKETEAAVYVQQRFQLKELTYGGAGIAMPFARVHAGGFSVNSSGFAAYRENRVGVCYAVELAEALAIGVRANYASLSITDYGSVSTVYLDIGAQTRLSSEWTVGFSAQNVNRSHLTFQNGSEEDLATFATLGISYQPGNSVFVTAEAVKDLAYPLGWRIGAEYHPVTAFAIRIGASRAPVTWNAGIGWAKGPLVFDFAYGFHESLGYTPTFSLNYKLQKRG